MLPKGVGTITAKLKFSKLMIVRDWGLRGADESSSKVAALGLFILSRVSFVLGSVFHLFVFLLSLEWFVVCVDLACT